MRRPERGDLVVTPLLRSIGTFPEATRAGWLNGVLEPSAWRRHPVLPDDDLAQWSPLHAVVAIADAHGGHADIWAADEVCCPGCGWRRPLTPGGPSAWEVSNEHLLDVAVPVLVAAGDLATADVPAFRQLAPRFPGRLAELLRQLQVAEPVSTGRR